MFLSRQRGGNLFELLQRNFSFGASFVTAQGKSAERRGSPLRYFQVVLRSVFLKGSGLDVLWPQMAAMAVFGAIMLTISVFRFHKSLD